MQHQKLSRREMWRINTNGQEVQLDATQYIESLVSGYCRLCILVLRFANGSARRAGTNKPGHSGREDLET
jgi:hypothetical protein